MSAFDRWGLPQTTEPLDLRPTMPASPRSTGPIPEAWQQAPRITTILPPQPSRDLPFCPASPTTRPPPEEPPSESIPPSRLRWKAPEATPAPPTYSSLRMFLAGGVVGVLVTALAAALWLRPESAPA